MNKIKTELTWNTDILYLFLTPILVTCILEWMDFFTKNTVFFPGIFSPHGNDSTYLQVYYPIFGIVTLLINIFRKYRLSDLGFVLSRDDGKVDIICSFAVSVMTMFFLIQFATVFYYTKLIRLFYYVPMQDVINFDVFWTLDLASKIVCYISAVIFYGILPGLGFALIKKNIDKLIEPKNKYFNWGSFICVFLFILIHVLYAYDSGDLVTEATKFFFRFIFIYTMMLSVDLSGTSWSCPFMFTFLWHAC